MHYTVGILGILTAGKNVGLRENYNRQDYDFNVLVSQPAKRYV